LIFRYKNYDILPFFLNSNKIFLIFKKSEDSKSFNKTFPYFLYKLPINPPFFINKFFSDNSKEKNDSITKRHYQSFFGKKCALIINSNSDNGDFYLNFIQEKENGKWETYKEGLNIKLGLKEICEILYILEKNRGKTNIIHKYKNNPKIYKLLKLSL